MRKLTSGGAPGAICGPGSARSLGDVAISTMRPDSAIKRTSFTMRDCSVVIIALRVFCLATLSAGLGASCAALAASNTSTMSEVIETPVELRLYYNAASGALGHLLLCRCPPSHPLWRGYDVA